MIIYDHYRVKSKTLGKTGMVFGMKEPWIKGLISQFFMAVKVPLAAIQCTDKNIGETNKPSGAGCADFLDL